MKAVFQTKNLLKNKSFTISTLRYFSNKSTPVLKNYINGEFVESKATNFYEIHNPATNVLISLVPETPKDEFDHAVSIAKNSFKSWKNVPISNRQRYMFDYLRLLRENHV